MDPELKALLQERLKVAKSMLEVEQKKLETAHSSREEVFRQLSLVVKAQTALTTKAQDEVPLREQQLGLAREIEQEVRKKIEVGAAPPSDELQARFRRLTAECDLLKAKRRLNTK